MPVLGRKKAVVPESGIMIVISVRASATKCVEHIYRANLFSHEIGKRACSAGIVPDHYAVDYWQNFIAGY
jgi:hypothetical protein